MVEQLTVADAFGSHYVTTAPFRARLLRQKQRWIADVPTITPYLRVPGLESADAALLAQIASNEEAVENMKRALRRALRGVEETDVGGGVQALQTLVDDLVDEARNQLSRSIKRSVVWSAAVPAGITLSGLALGASPLLATAVSMASAVAPYVAARKDHRARPAWMLLTAQRSKPLQKNRRTAHR